jgi:hypothetical protein
MDQDYIQSDGCVGKLENVHIFQWLCMLHKKIKVPHIYNYFESEHGKGDHYGVGTCVKKTLCRQEMKFITTSLI